MSDSDVGDAEPKPLHDLHQFMAQVAAEMASEYGRIYARAAEDPGTAGDEGEENWASLFRDWLPANYHVATKGRIIGPDGTMSPQIDVLILKPTYPPKLLEKRVWLAGGVAAAFECKTTLTATHVRAGLDRCARFKLLYSPRQGTPRRELRSALIYGLLAHSHSWKAANSDPIGAIERAFESSEASIQHPRLDLDFLCVADLATWSLLHTTSYDASWRPTEKAQLEAEFGAPRGPMTARMRAAATGGQATGFQPVGALLNELTEELAWNDPAIRDIADYYRMANLGGSSQGSGRPWPVSIYSDAVRQQIVAGRFSNGVPWDEWSLGC
jgi:hypothetical protein